MKSVRASLGLLLWIVCAAAWADATCQGRFPNPITDICWSCVFPLTIGNAQVMQMGQEDNGTGGAALCSCQRGANFLIGVNTGFWEPVRMAEAVRKPYCFAGLGGITIDAGIDAPSHAQAQPSGGVPNHSFYQMHWYIAPLLYWLEVLLDETCLEQMVFDLAYITELDPLWADSESNFILSPDAVIFANPLAKAVCAADCVAATSGFGLNSLYWCAGCQGSMFPLEGWVQAHIGGVQASTLLTQRLTAKMHRELLMWAASGAGGQCGYYPQPLMDKTNYKMQMVYPIPATEKIDGKCCQPYGRTTILSGAGKEFPVRGEDFVYQIFRKRNCCSGASLF